jgi:hypothetical protein
MQKTRGRHSTTPLKNSRQMAEQVDIKSLKNYEKLPKNKRQLFLLMID